MEAIQKVYQQSCCSMGMHVPPPRRTPHGPVVADCVCCGKTVYFYGLAAMGFDGTPVLFPTTIKMAPTAR